MKKIHGRIMAMLAVVLIAASLNSCHKMLNCLHGNGNPIIEERTVGDFYMVTSNGSFDVYVFPSTRHRVEVDAESNLIDYISTRVSGNKLVIENRNNRCLNNTIPIIINVYTPYVDEITLNGSGFVSAYGLSVEEMFLTLNGSGSIDVDLDADYLQASIAGSGSIDVSGVVSETDLSISGSGNLYAYPLRQQKCYANISGSGNMYLNVSRLLDARISGSGTTYYRGNPDVFSTITGSGRIIRQ
jgi:hypothetical protein